MPRCSALTVWKADRETGRGSPRQQAPLWLASQRSWEALVPIPQTSLPGEQVLLSLSDEDLELGLGVCSSLHRRKLRLAIEDYRDAEAGRR